MNFTVRHTEKRKNTCIHTHTKWDCWATPEPQDSLLCQTALFTLGLPWERLSVFPHTYMCFVTCLFKGILSLLSMLFSNGWVSKHFIFLKISEDFRKLSFVWVVLICSYSSSNKNMSSKTFIISSNSCNVNNIQEVTHPQKHRNNSTDRGKRHCFPFRQIFAMLCFTENSWILTATLAFKMHVSLIVEVYFKMHSLTQTCI